MQGRVQIGAPWWWNDHFRGIYDWLDAAMYYSVLSGFFGFTTDSRCILSLSRHDYFRRVLSSFLSDKVRSGELNGKFDVLAEIICRLSRQRREISRSAFQIRQAAVTLRLYLRIFGVDFAFDGLHSKTAFIIYNGLHRTSYAIISAQLCRGGIISTTMTRY